MRCGTRSRVGWLLLLASLLLFSGSSWALDYDGPELPEGWFPIHDSELTQLEQIQQQQEMRLSELQMQSRTHEQTIKRLEMSFEQYVIAERAKGRRETLISGGIGFLCGIVATIIAVR